MLQDVKEVLHPHIFLTGADLQGLCSGDRRGMGSRTAVWKGLCDTTLVLPQSFRVLGLPHSLYPQSGI